MRIPQVAPMLVSGTRLCPVTSLVSSFGKELIPNMRIQFQLKASDIKLLGSRWREVERLRLRICASTTTTSVKYRESSGTANEGLPRYSTTALPPWGHYASVRVSQCVHCSASAGTFHPELARLDGPGGAMLSR